jgi:cytochrome c biogenesis protein CcmG/thiol:disulfide interchange protein DsbE
MRRRLLFLLPLAAFALLAAWFVAGLDPERDPSAIPSALIDRPVPAFALPALADGAPGLASESLQGDVVLVNFFASWCVPCRIEHPLLERLAREHDVPIYGIVYKDEPAAIERWIADLGSPYRAILVDADSRVALEFGVYGVPETYVIDRDGRVRLRIAGPLDAATVEETLLPLIEELSGPGE